MTLIPELDSVPAGCLRDSEALTADAIVKSLELVTVDLPNHWILAGGGWNNPIITSELSARLQRRLNAKPLHSDCGRSRLE